MLITQDIYNAISGNAINNGGFTVSFPLSNNNTKKDNTIISSMSGKYYKRFDDVKYYSDPYDILKLTISGSWDKDYLFEMHQGDLTVPSGAETDSYTLRHNFKRIPLPSGCEIVSFDPTVFDNLIALKFDNLEFISNTLGSTAYVANCPIQYLSFPNLTYCSGLSYLPGDLLYLDVPQLQTVNNLLMNMSLTLTSVQFPQLENISFTGGEYTLDALKILSLPSLVYMSGSLEGFASLYSLETLILGSVGTTKQLGNLSLMVRQSFNQNNIDRLLATYTSCDGTNDTINFRSGVLYLAGNNMAIPSFNGIKHSGVGSQFIKGDGVWTGIIPSHGLVDGDLINIIGTTGTNTSAINTSWYITKVDNNKFTIPCSATANSGANITSGIYLRRCSYIQSDAIIGETPVSGYATVYSASHGFRPEVNLVSTNIIADTTGLVTVTCPSHGLSSGDICFISNSYANDEYRYNAFNGCYILSSGGSNEFSYFAGSGAIGLSGIIQANIKREAENIAIYNAIPTGFNGVYQIRDVRPDSFVIINSTSGEATQQGNISKDGYIFYQLLISKSGNGFNIDRSNTVTIKHP